MSVFLLKYSKSAKTYYEVPLINYKGKMIHFVKSLIHYDEALKYYEG